MKPLTALPNHSDIKQVSRTGRLWEPTDYDLLVQGLQEGLDLPALAQRLGRPLSSVSQRLRRLLPVAQRGCLPEHVLDAVRFALADDDYDWRAEMLLSPPIVRQEIVRTGLEGLTDAQVVTIAYALMVSGGAAEGALLKELAPRLHSEQLIEQIVSLRAHRVLRSSSAPLTWEQVSDHARCWVHGVEYHWRRPGRYPPDSEW